VNRCPGIITAVETVKSKTAHDQFAQLHSVKGDGNAASITSIRKGARRFRILYLPFNAPTGVNTSQLMHGKPPLSILSKHTRTRTERQTSVQCMNVIIEVDIPEFTPDRMRWTSQQLQ